MSTTSSSSSSDVPTPVSDVAPTAAMRQQLVEIVTEAFARQPDDSPAAAFESGR